PLIIAILPYDPDGQLVLHQRRVVHPIERIVATTLIDLAPDSLESSGVTRRVGLVGDDAQQPAHRATAVQRTLGSLENLYACDVEQVEVRCRLVVRDHHIVDVDSGCVLRGTAQPGVDAI